MQALAEIPIFFSHVFPWPFILVGAWFACKAARQMIHAGGSRGWPAVEGKVVRTGIEVSDTGGDYSHDLFAPVVEFRFVVDGVSKTRRRLAMTDINPGSKAGAEAIVKRYKTGSKVRVYCSPHDPEMTILEPGLRWPMVGKLVFGLLFLGAGVAMLSVFGGLSPATN